MSEQIDQQWLRKFSLIVGSPGTDQALDLSDFHCKFKVTQSDEESPNTVNVRVYNLDPSTVKQIIGKTPVEYTRVVLQAGYQDAQFGVIFDGTIKQFHRGNENSTDTYLDILAAAGDVEYNFGICNSTLAAGSTPQDRAKAISAAMGLDAGTVSPNTLAVTGGTLPRGKVLWGLGRTQMRCLATSMGSTWSIQDGKVTIIPLTGYLPGEAVVLTRDTGLVGIPEQTDQGIAIRCLLNPKLRIGGQVQLDNTSVNQTIAQTSSSLPSGQLTYNSRTGVQFLADVSNDGFYRIYVIEYQGDTRGQEWYSDLICLSIDQSSKTVQAYG